MTVSHAAEALIGPMGTARRAGVDAARMDAGAIVAFASAHLVLPALHGAVRGEVAGWPGELADFLAAVNEGNRARNEALRAALWEMARALNAIGIEPLVLKGGAFLADPRAGDTSWRFMSDLDVLVDPARLDESVRAVRALGYAPVREHYDARHEAHYPPLISSCGTFSIEIHERLFAVHEIALPVSAITARAVPVQGPADARLLLPSPEHRIAHLAAHAQLHNRFHMVKRIVLRDMLDLDVLLAAHGPSIDWDAVLAPFESRRDRHAARALLCAWSMLRGAGLPVAFTPQDRRWAGAALSRLRAPLWQRRLLLPLDLVRAEVMRIATERGHLRRRLLLLDPARLVRTHAAWRHKLAQRLWA